MRPLRPGEETRLQWRGGAVECHVVAAAGSFVLLRPARITLAPVGACSLTTVGGDAVRFEGDVTLAPHPHELRFRVTSGRPADRRATVRVPVSVPVEVTDEAGSLQAELLDVSAGGMRFRRAERLPAGTFVHVRAELPDGPVVEGDAVVRACDAESCAVQFPAPRTDVGTWTVDRLRSEIELSLR
jgi:hypothetical protein